MKKASISKRIRTYFSFLLIFTLILTTMPIQSFALPNKKLGNGMTIVDKTKRSKPKNVFPKVKDKSVELKTRRKANVKEYANPDGTFTLEVSKKPMHYKDKRGHWKNIDNTLVQSNKGGYKFENKSNSFKARFAENNEINQLVQFGIDDNHWISFSPSSKFSSKGIATDTKIEYKDFKPGMDLIYELDNDKLKEEIVLKSYPNTNTFEFDMQYKGLLLEKDEQGIIWAKSKKTGEKIFYFHKSFAEDANEDITLDAELNIIDEQGKEKLVLTVNDEWLQNAEYPVVIDPTIEVIDKNIVENTWITDWYPNNEYYWSSDLHVGYSNSFGKVRSLVKFNYLPSLPPGARIKDAKLGLFMQSDSSNGPSINVYRIIANWQEASVNWTNSPDIDSDNIIFTGSYIPGAEWQFEITSLVKDWYNGTKPNYGVLLKSSDETSAGVDMKFYSKNATGVQTPRLIINYEVDPLGSESFYGFDGNVNVHNGNLVLQATDVTLPGKGIPISISRTYNSRGNGSTIVGDRWRLNVDMKIDYTSDENVVFFTDGDGTTKHFVKNDENGNYTSPVGVKLTLKKDAQNRFYLEEESGLKYYFDSSGRLDFIMDNNSNVTDIVYNQTTGQIAQIIDPSNRYVDFNYTSGKLASITGNQIPTIEYIYNGEYLTSVKKKDGTTVLEEVSYGYDIYNNISSVTDNANNITNIYYSWTSELGTRVDKVEKKLTINSVLQTLNTTYSYVEDSNGDGFITTVTHPKEDVTEYITNKMGNVVNVIEDKNGKALNTQYSWDEMHNLLEVINPKEYRTGINYTKDYKVEKVENAQNDSIIYKYDEDGNVKQFLDPSGRPTINNYDPDSRNMLGTASTLFSTSVMDYDNVGNIVSQTNPIGIGENSVANSNFESWPGSLPNLWIPAGGSGGTISADALINANGKYSVKLQSYGSSYSQQAVLVSDSILVDPSTKYNVSWYVKNSSSSSTNATVEVHWYNDINEEIAVDYDLAPTKGNQDWIRKSARINSPLYTDDGDSSNDVKYAKIYLVLDNTGTAWFDNIQFEKGSAINNHNLVVNESFEVDSDPDIVPDHWDTGTLRSIDGITTVESRTGETSIEINGDTENRHFSQALNIQGKAGSPLHFSGWSKASGVSAGGSYYQVLLGIEYTDNTVDWFGADLNKYDHDWEYTEKVAVAKKDFDRVLIYGKLQNHPDAKVWFDDFNVKLYGAANALISSYNLSENSSFEYDRDSTSWPDAWPKYAAVAAEEDNNMFWVKTNGNENAYNGQQMVKISDVSNTAVVTTITPEPIKSNKTYTASAVIKTDNVSGSGAILKFNILDANDQYLTEKVISKPITGTTDWTRVALTLSEDEAKTLNSNAAKLTVSVGTAGSTSGSMYFDDVRFNEGSKATTYSFDSNKNYVTGITNQLENTINFINDARGNVKTITDLKNNSFNFTYDKLDRIKSASNPQGLTTNYIYHDNGNIRQIDNDNASGYYNTAIIKDYNEMGLVKSITDGSYENITYFEYDKNANLTDIDYPNGKGINFSYDTADRLTDIDYVNSGTSYDFNYDNNGNVTEVYKNSIQTISNTYDTLDRLDRTNFFQIGKYIDYDYNPSGQVTKIENSIVATKDTDNLISVEYDQAGNPVGIDGVNGINAAFMYDEEGKIKKSYIAGSGMHYIAYRTYDDTGRIARYRVEKSGGGIILDYQYEYDENGNRTKEIDNMDGTRVEYNYDELNQLTEERHYDTVPDPDVLTKKITYDYDILGNRILSSEQGGSTYNFGYTKETNEIESLNGSNIYIHDANGNLTNADDWEYIYNDANQLVTVKNGITTIADYEYNSEGLRTKKVVDGKTELYYYSGNKLAYVTDGANSLKYFFLRDMTGKLINMIDYTAGKETYWYLYDAHGSVVGLADKNGYKVASYKYDAWGNITSNSSTVNTGDGVPLWKANPFRYSAYQYDDETDFYYLKSRYYSPFLGRFITRDTILALNLYAFAGNNPVNFVDPSGYIYVIDGDGNDKVLDFETANKKSRNKNNNKSSGSAKELVKDVSTSVGLSILSSEGLSKAVQQSDEVFEYLNGISSGAPSAVRFIGIGAQFYGAGRDVKSIANDATPFNMYFSIVSVSSNFMPFGIGVPANLVATGAKKGYDHSPTWLQQQLDKSIVDGFIMGMPVSWNLTNIYK